MGLSVTRRLSSSRLDRRRVPNKPNNRDAPPVNRDHVRTFVRPRSAQSPPWAGAATSWGLDVCYDTITRCCFNVRSKADMTRLNLPHGNNN